MSFLATRWAWSQQTGSSSQKLVLLALADCAENDCWEYNPSVARLSAMTGLDRKTVMKSLLSLAEQGLISARGRNGCKKTYVLNAKPIPNMGQVKEETDTKNGTGTESGTGTKFGIGTSTKNGTGTSTNFGTHTYQPINLSIVKETNKESFEDFDAPLSEQIENAQLEHCENVLDDPEHVLTSVEMVVLGKILGVRIANNAKVKEIADRKTLTVELFRQCVSEWKTTNTHTGYLIGTLRNASLNPETTRFKSQTQKKNKELLKATFGGCGIDDLLEAI